jgi:hypothetical protein
MPANALMIPPRSRLYGLGVIESGGYTECLTSLVLRLAQAHQVAPADLVRHVLARVLGKRYARKGFHRPFAGGSAFNGAGRVAADWVAALEEVTGHRPYSVATLLAWRGWTPRGVSTPHKRWCSACYEETQAAQNGIWDALLWTVRPVEMCLRHHVRLSDRCPRCGRLQPWLGPRQVPGHCVACRSWLGGPVVLITDPWLEWCAITVADALHRHRTYDPAVVHRHLQHLVRTQFAGSVAGAAHALHSSKGSVSEWVTGRHQPSLDVVLRLAWATGTSLNDWLTDTLLPPAPWRDLPPRPRGERKRPAPLSPEVQERVLAANHGEMSAARLAQSVGVDRRLLYAKMPHEMTQVAAHFRRRQRHRSRARQARIRRWMAGAVHDLLATGADPTQRRIETILPKPWSFQEPAIRTIWHRTRQGPSYTRGHRKEVQGDAVAPTV